MRILKFFSAAMSFIICFISSSTGLWKEPVESVQSIQMVTDGFYTMDYKYDYDIDNLLKRGVPNHADLYAHGLINTVTGNFKNLLNPKGFACTTFNSVNSQGEYLFSRNFDYMESPSMLVWTHPKNGYESISSVSLYFFAYSEKGILPEDEFSSILTTLAPYAPLDGINEKGLSIGVLELEKAPLFQISLKPDLTTTTVIRACLDKAATVEEAIEIFKSHDVRDLLLVFCTYHYHIADAQGNSVIIEYVNGKMNLIYPEKNKENKVNYQAAANFYLTKGVKDPRGMGQDRYEKVMKALKKSKGLTSEKQAMNMLKGVSMKNADLHGFKCSTLWSTVYNTHDLTVDVCVNNDYNKIYHFALNKPQKLM